VLGQQPFESGHQLADALFFVLGDSVEHGLPQEVPGPSPAGFRSLADGGAGGVTESEVQQDTALSVWVMGGQDVDGQYTVESTPKCSQRTPRSLGALQSQQSDAVVAAGQSHDTTRTTQFTVGGRPGQSDLDRVVRGHGCVAFLPRPADP
jgi:hypothetical protein